MSEAASAFGGPATLVFRRKVKPGRDQAYKDWVASFQHASRQVKGFLGASTMGPGVQDNVYISIVRFETFDDLRAWEDSELRSEWLDRLPRDTVDGEAEIRTLKGLEFWFTAPGVPTPIAPSRHKMALVVVVLVLILVSILTPLLRGALGSTPPFARTVLMVLLQVGLMTYVIMPRVTRWLSGWLFK